MSDILFARPSTASGVARVLDLMGVFDSYNSSSTPEEADARAMFSDWRAVGRDLFWAMTHANKDEDSCEQESA